MSSASTSQTSTDFTFPCISLITDHTDTRLSTQFYDNMPDDNRKPVMRSIASSMSKHSTPSVSLDISPITLPTDMATHNVSLGATTTAADTLHDVKLRDLQRTIIKQSLDYRTLFYTPTYAQTWGQDSEVQKSMIAILTAFGTLEKFDDRFNYGLGDKTIYRSHDGDPDPKRDHINRQLVEWVSEGQRSYLPTFEEALGDMRQSDSAYNILAVALDNVRRLR